MADDTANISGPPPYTSRDDKFEYVDHKIAAQSFAVPTELRRYTAGVVRFPTGCSEPETATFVHKCSDVSLLSGSTTFGELDKQIRAKVVRNFSAVLSTGDVHLYQVITSANYKTDSGEQKVHYALTSQNFVTFLQVLDSKNVDTLRLKTAFYPRSPLKPIGIEPPAKLVEKEASSKLDEDQELGELSEGKKVVKEGRKCIMM